MVLSLALLAAIRVQSTFIADRVQPALHDVMEKVRPNAVVLDGYLGHRVELNESARLRNVDLMPLLAGFHRQPGSHPWIGEHIGKWIHAATLSFAYSNDLVLRHKVDDAVNELVRCQQPDGYLGTYTTDKRFGLYEGADWDVWTHKYDLIGLLAYHQFTGDTKALECCKKIGDLLIKTFGPDKKSILKAGTHMGMASTSVLEPMVLLYRRTGDQRYLNFAKYIVNSWTENGGPNIVGTLEANQPIDKVANGKAYEMLSNLVGLCELGRTIGDQRYVDAAKRAWDDIVAHELYITGSSSYYEHFHSGFDLPNEMSKNVGETCVTVTWIQLSEELLRLTGEAKYANEIEKSLYNHLAAAQNPDGKSWCYYTSLEGKKPYTAETCCCLSSGPRGMAMAPNLAYLSTRRNGKPYVVINNFETSSAAIEIDGHQIHLNQESQFPSHGKSRIIVRAPRSTRFGILIRLPNWAMPMTSTSRNKAENGWLVIPPRTYRSGESINLNYKIAPTIVSGTGPNIGKAAAMWGPFVLACQGSDSERVLTSSLINTPIKPTRKAFEFTGSILNQHGHQLITLVPFSEVGKNGEKYRVWMWAPGTKPPTEDEVHLGTEEARSEDGNAEGSIKDGDTNTYVVTFNGKLQLVGWFSLSFRKPKLIRSIEFTHGRTFHDGGWFDTSSGSPTIEAQLVRNGPWIRIGELKSYPATSISDPGGLRGGETFLSELASPISAIAIRITGKPASGDNPTQSFTSCGELKIHIQESMNSARSTKSSRATGL
jgi:hypothetical protein